MTDPKDNELSDMKVFKRIDRVSRPDIISIRVEDISRVVYIDSQTVLIMRSPDKKDEWEIRVSDDIVDAIFYISQKTDTSSLTYRVLKFKEDIYGQADNINEEDK
jgi:hypothetical protein